MCTKETSKKIQAGLSFPVVETVWIQVDKVAAPSSLH
jgi:hypothetical protein